MKIALSTTGIEGARKNMEAEVPAWDFEGVKKTAHDDWNSYLSRIDVTGTEDEKTNFYTCFYHALIQPNQISDVDGLYRNAADSVVKAGTGTFYSTFSLWDTYRAAHPFYTLMVPEKVDGFVNSLVEQSEVQGFLPIWGLWGKETYTMVGNHGVSVIAEAYRKGFRGFDAERAFNAIKQTQTVSHKQKSDWETYMKYGYFPTDLIKTESVSSSSNRYTTIMQPQTWLNVWARQKMRLTSPNVRISTRICLIRKPSLCVRVIRTELGRLRSTPVRWHTPKVPVVTIPKEMPGNILGMCSMMFRDSSVSLAARNLS